MEGLTATEKLEHVIKLKLLYEDLSGLKNACVSYTKYLKENIIKRN